jgi:hypothetical protein
MQREPWRDLWRAAGSRFAEQLEEWRERAADQLGDGDAVDSLIKQAIGRQGMADGRAVHCPGRSLVSPCGS